LSRENYARNAFDIIGIHTNQYKGRRWLKSEHDLDYIAEHKSGRLAIGVEVKNTLSVPERTEIQTKISICTHLGVTPLFAARWMKPYVQLIRNAGGFAWFFKTQIYPLGFEKLTETVWRRLRLPMAVRTELPERSIVVFNRWVKSKTT